MPETTSATPQIQLQRIAALLGATSTELLSSPHALDHAPTLLDLHHAEGQVRLQLDPDHHDVPTLLVTDRPGALLAEATRLLDTLDEAAQSPLHETRLILERANGTIGAL